ncbi:MAG: hypothetical protein K2H29_10260 [Oscillospiraceae bacterium]|nr:hypothetical protein [Oscillospiraceae bacterium]
MGFIFLTDSSSDMQNIVSNIVSDFLIVYIGVSWCWLFVGITGNWFIGIVTALFIPILVYDKIKEKYQDNPKMGKFIIYILFLAVIIVDVINIIRYFVLKLSLVKSGITIRKLSKAEMQSYKEERLK